MTGQSTPCAELSALALPYQGPLPPGAEFLPVGRAKRHEVHPALRRHECDEIRMLTLGVPVVGIAVEPEELGHTGIARAAEEEQPPAQRGAEMRIVASALPNVVLTVTKGALAVLPGLPPGMDDSPTRTSSWETRPSTPTTP